MQESVRQSLFTPHLFVIGGIRPLSDPFKKWLETNPTEKEQMRVRHTLKELASLYDRFRALMEYLHCLDSQENSEIKASKINANLDETIIRLRELMYGEKGWWISARYGDDYICGLESYIYGVQSQHVPFLRKVILTYSNGRPRDISD